MKKSDNLIRSSGCGLVAAGLLYLPLSMLDGWSSIADIGTSRWWFVQSAATLHHVFLLFGLIGLFVAAVRRPGLSGASAFVTASAGNGLVIGVGAVQLTVLPALAAHPDAASGLDCSPFYSPATEAAAAFISAACEPWHFGALEAWVGIAWLLFAIGSIWLAVEIVRGRLVQKWAGLLLGAAWATQLLGIAVPLPNAVSRGAFLAISIALIACGTALLRQPSARPSNRRSD
jgi:hypothetical protein